MTVMNYAAFRELRDAYRSAATSAAQRGDAEAMSINREADRDLLAQVKPPRLIPDTIDGCLAERRAARDMGAHVIANTQHNYGLACRQYDFAARLNAVIARRIAE